MILKKYLLQKKKIFIYLKKYNCNLSIYISGSEMKLFFFFVAIEIKIKFMATKDFITFTPSSGSESESISVTASKNTGSVRNTTLNISGQSITKVINISQEKIPINMVLLTVVADSNASNYTIYTANSNDNIYYATENSSSIPIKITSNPVSLELIYRLDLGFDSSVTANNRATININCSTCSIFEIPNSINFQVLIDNCQSLLLMNSPWDIPNFETQLFISASTVIQTLNSKIPKLTNPQKFTLDLHQYGQFTTQQQNQLLSYVTSSYLEVKVN